MQRVKDDTIGGYNEFIKSQQQVPGKATYTLAQFDDRYELLQDCVDIADARILNERNYQPRGMTRLLDAIGKTMNTIGERLAALPEAERPSKVVFAIMTDGRENDSQEYTEEKVREMIEHQQDVYKWEVLFLSSDIHCEQDAFRYGIQAANTLSYDPSGVGTQVAFASMADNLTSYRTGVAMSMAFDAKQRKRAKTKAKQKSK